MTDPLLFLLAVATLLATPGPTNTLMATAGALNGVRRSLHLLGAELVAYLIAIFAIRAVLAPLLHDIPAISITIKLVVAAYLLWLAVKLWRQKLVASETAQPVRFRNVFITTLLNPKGIIFALTLIPREAPGLVWYFAGFSALVLLAGGGWLLLGGGLGAASGRLKSLLPRTAAVVLTGFAGVIAASAL